MRTSTIRLALLGMLVACGCGAGDEPTSSSSTGGEAPAETCEGYALDDACMNEDNLAQCRAMAAQCPGQVQVMESCPLQFGCPSGGDGAAAPTAETCEGHAVDDPCMGEDAFAACQAAAAECPGEVQVMESCPLQFGCP